MLGLGNSLSNPPYQLSNYSLEFDGINQAVQIDGVTSVIDVDEGTFSAWVKCGDMDSSRLIVGVAKDSNNYIRLWWYHSLGQFSVTYKRGGNASRADATTSTSVLTDDTWHHLAATWDTTVEDGELKIYYDGGLTDATTINTTAAMETMDQADIGRSSTGAGYWEGNIDEVAIFSEALDTPTVRTIYNNRNITNLIAGNLIGYWKFNEGREAVTADSSSNSNTGSLENTPEWSLDTP